MHKRHEEWARLTTDQPAPAARSGQPPLRIIELPGFQRMEDMLLLNPPRKGTYSPQVEGYADHLSRDTFGIIENDTQFKVPRGHDERPEWSEEWIAVEEQWDEHDEQYETTHATDDEAVEILLKHGIDFRDARGQPLHCTKLFCRQAEAAAKGLMGKMPDRHEAGLQTWTEKLERDARQFRSKVTGR